ncbi:MAG TPA: type II toxin-antitoxin system prevent-host-death family antitoxin [Burkholderiales bacterium]|jgi:prevent-host-death family protein|nr:type II toxin-antitoxin system prevent-host-death family antitoxin [Burkholderiales bacterium]
MSEVNVTELRQNLPDYLAEVRKGKELKITVRGKVIARIVPEKGVKNAARQRLVVLRTKCKVGDVISPTGERWTAERGRS